MTPAVAGGTVYVGSCAGVYLALDLQNGSVRWRHDFTRDAGHATFHGDPLLSHGLIITPTEAIQPEHTRAFERQTGRTAWRVDGEWALTGSDVIGVGELAVGRNARGDLVGLDIVTGEVVWHVPHEGQRFEPDVAESPATDGAAVYFSAPDGAVYRVNASVGEVVWRVELGCNVTTSVLLSDEDVVVGCRDGRLFRLAAANGRTHNTLSLEHRIEGRLLLTGERIVVPSGTQWLSAVDRAAGRVVWVRRFDSQLSVVQPIAWRGVVLTGSASGTLLALAPGDGRTLWSIQLEGQLRGLGAHGTGLLVGSIEGTLFALSEEPAG